MGEREHDAILPAASAAFEYIAGIPANFGETFCIGGLVAYDSTCWVLSLQNVVAQACMCCRFRLEAEQGVKPAIPVN